MSDAGTRDFEQECLKRGLCPACLNYGHRMDHHLRLVTQGETFGLKCRNCQREYTVDWTEVDHA